MTTAFILFYILGMVFIGIPAGISTARDLVSYTRKDFGDYFAAGLTFLVLIPGWPVLIVPAVGWLVTRGQ